MGVPCPGSGTDDKAEAERVAGFGGQAGQAIMFASADGIIAVDEHGCVRVCNPAAEELFERSAGELIGSMFGYPITVGKSTEIELVLPEGGGRLVEMRVTSTTLEGERVLVAALRDVTWRRRQEKELEAALDREQSVVAVAAHELRNPLAAIAALAHVLRDLRTDLTNEQRVMIADRIVERTVYLQTLTRKLLIVSRIDGQPERSSPRRVPVLDLILERLTELDATSGDVNVSCSADLEALVDPGELSEMLVNCLENAFAHGRPPFEVGAAERKGWVEVRVCDSGPGVPKEFVPYLFERFSRAPGVREAEGSGLGLWIVRSLAQANGGDVRYEPGKRGGARFVLRLRPAPRL
jgi:signal transduction histidine kinase